MGFGSNEIMNISYQNKLSYQRFLESDFMKKKKKLPSDKYLST